MKKLLIAGSLTLVSANAFADEDRGFYFNAGYGQAQYDVAQQDLDDIALFAFESNGATVLDASSSFDDKGSTWSLTSGYRFSRYFALEVGYLNLGSAEYRAVGPVFIPGLGVVDATMGIDISTKGPIASAAGFIPLGEKFDLHGHVGMFFSDTALDIAVGLDDVSSSEEVSARSQDLFAGIGTAFHFTQNVAVSLDYSLFKDVGDEEETGEGDIDSLRLGIQYRF